MFNLKTIGKFNGSKFDKLTSHPAIEEPCYMKFRKVVYRNILPMKIAETMLQYLSLGYVVEWLEIP